MQFSAQSIFYGIHTTFNLRIVKSLWGKLYFLYILFWFIIILIIFELASKDRRMSAASIALEVAEAEGQLVSVQTICHTLQQVSLHGHHPRRKPLLKLAQKKAWKQFAEDNLAKNMKYWKNVLWSDELKVNLFDSDGVQQVWWRLGEYQENNNLHMDSTYLQTVQKTMCKIQIHILSTHSVL